MKIDADSSPRDFDESEEGPPSPFPLDAFPQAVAEYVAAVSISTGAPVEYPAACVLAVAATALGASRSLRVKPGWRELPVLFVALVGDPGSRKSPAMRIALAPLEGRQDEFDADFAGRLRGFERDAAIHDSAFAEWKRSREGDPPEAPGRPTRRVVVLTDATIEALVPALAENRRGILYAADELAGWYRAHDRYTKGTDRQVYLSLWSSSAIRVHRKSGREYQSVSEPFACILGGIQPSILGELRQRPDGMAERFLYAVPASSDTFSRHGLAAGLETRWTRIVDRLLSLPMANECASVELEFDDEARERFFSWAERACAEKHLAPRHARGFLVKFEGYCARVALVLEHLSWAADAASCAAQAPPTAVSERTVRSAELVIEHFRLAALRLFGWPARSAILRKVREALEAVPVGCSRTALHGALARHATSDELDKALGLLEEDGEAHRVVEPTGGRPREVWRPGPAPKTDGLAILPSGATLEPDGLVRGVL